MEPSSRSMFRILSAYPGAMRDYLDDHPSATDSAYDRFIAVCDLLTGRERELTVQELITWSDYVCEDVSRKLYSEGRKVLTVFKELAESDFGKELERATRHVMVVKDTTADVGAFWRVLTKQLEKLQKRVERAEEPDPSPERMAAHFVISSPQSRHAAKLERSKDDADSPGAGPSIDVLVKELQEFSELYKKFKKELVQRTLQRLDIRKVSEYMLHEDAKGHLKAIGKLLEVIGRNSTVLLAKPAYPQLVLDYVGQFTRIAPQVEELPERRSPPREMKPIPSPKETPIQDPEGKS